MKIIVDIPEKEFGVEIADHFQDFFERLQAEINSRLMTSDTLVCGAYELETIKMFLKAFKNATILQEPKMGHWIHLKHNKGKCSECHDVVLIAQMYGNANYCPNCSARMSEASENADSN